MDVMEFVQEIILPIVWGKRGVCKKTFIYQIFFFKKSQFDDREAVDVGGYNDRGGAGRSVATGESSQHVAALDQL